MNSRILHLTIKRNLKLIILSLLLIIISACATPFSINFLRISLEQTENVNLSMGILFIIFYCVLLLVSEVGKVISEYFIKKLSKYLSYTMKDMLFNHLLKVKLFKVCMFERGDMINKFSSCDTISNSIVMPLSKFISIIIKLVIGLIMIIRIDIIILIVLVTPIPIWILLNNFIIKKLKIKYNSNKENQLLIWKFISEFFSSIEDHKVWLWGKASLRKYGKQKERHCKTNMEVDGINQIKSIVDKAFLLLVFLLTLFIGYISVIDINTVDLIAVYFYINMIYGTILEINNLNVNFSSIKSEYSKINEVLMMPVYEKGFHNNFSSEYLFRLSNATIDYDGEIILKDIDLKICYNEFIVILGESGSGKSSLLNVLLGVNELKNGSYYINGINSIELDWVVIRNKIGYLSQIPLLFSGTIKENILFGEKVNKNKLEYAIISCGLKSTLNSLENGIDTNTQEKGGGLSVGENQRFSLARNLYFDYPIWIFDEPTASIDYKNEEIIYNLLKKEKGKRTIIIVTHRKKILNLADRILVIKNNRIVESYNS